MKKIAIERDLSNIENYLRNEGYEVQEIDEKMKNDPSCFDKFDAIVLNDISRNMMGCEDVVTSTPTIDAVGMTPEQVKSLIDKTADRH